MKILRKFLAFILGLVLSAIIAAYLISYSVSNVIQTGLIKAAVQESLISTIIDNNSLSEEQQKQINEILEDEEVTTMFNDMFDEVINKLGTEDGVINKDSFNKLFDYFVDNKEKFESISGEEIDISEFEKFRDSSEYDEMTNSIMDSINESRSTLGETEKNAIKAYSFFTSQSFRNLMIIFGILDLLLIALVQWSLYKWIRTLGNTLLSSGVTLGILYFVINAVIENILYNLDISLNIDLVKLLNMALITIGSGVVLLIIYNVIKIVVKNVNKNKVIESESQINSQNNNYNESDNYQNNATIDQNVLDDNNEEKAERD